METERQKKRPISKITDESFLVGQADQLSNRLAWDIAEVVSMHSHTID